MQIKPVQVETILLARYVGCTEMKQIAQEFSYSIPHIYKLHKAGMAAVKELCE